MWRKGSLAVTSPSRAKYANPKGAHDPHGSEVQELRFHIRGLRLIGRPLSLFSS